MNTKTDGIWVWTAKAEEKAKELNLEERKENIPAWLGYSLLGQYAPKKWVEIGYVKELKCQVLIHNSKTKEPEWINGIITGATAGDIGEDFERINVLANGNNYCGCHPDCVRVI